MRFPPLLAPKQHGTRAAQRLGFHYGFGRVYFVVFWLVCVVVALNVVVATILEQFSASVARDEEDTVEPELLTGLEGKVGVRRRK